MPLLAHQEKSCLVPAGIEGQEREPDEHGDQRDHRDGVLLESPQVMRVSRTPGRDGGGCRREISATVVESADEYLSGDLGLGLAAATAVVSLCFAGTLIWQLSTRAYVVGIYWVTVLLASAVAAVLSSNMTEDLGLSAGGSAALWWVALTLILLGWYGGERTVSVHTICTRRREAWYWCAILCSFALGSSVDALVSEGLALGRATAVLIFVGLLGVICIAHFGLKMNAALTFWAACVVARPFGSSAGGLLSAATGDGGLGLGASATSTILLVLLLLLVGCCSAPFRRSGAGQVRTVRARGADL